ncbi:hypothetical protein OAS39_11235 [Pirellulales bacterium]|nr:hypothetical protein [Pirellulales bacterium]
MIKNVLVGKQFSRRSWSVVAALAMSPSVSAAIDAAVLTLGRPQITGNEASYSISLDFDTSAGEELVYFSLDVASSALELTAGGADFTRFSFTPASPPLDDFAMIPGAMFGADSLLSTAEFDTITTSLAPGAYSLGQLLVDFDGSGLTPGVGGAVSLAADDSVIGVETFGQPATFRFIDVEFQLSPATQPIDLIVADESDFLLSVVTGESASASVAGSPENILGGVRDVLLMFSDESGEGVLTAAKNDGEDVLNLVSSATAISELKLDYGLNEELNADFLGTAPEPFNAVIIDLAAIDGTGQLTVTLESDGVSNSFTRLIDSAGEIWFPFFNYPDVDLLAIDSVTVLLEGGERAADFALREIVLGVVIPEPGTAFLAFAAAVCSALVSPRRPERT